MTGGESRQQIAERMRAGVRSRITGLTRSAFGNAQRWTPPALLALLAAGAFAPLLASGVGVAALATAGISAMASVGGNVLTEIIRAGVERLRPAKAGGPLEDEVAAELEERFRQVLLDGGERADHLRAELARLLAEVGVVGTAVRAAVQAGDQELQAALTAGFDALGREFSEFGFVVADMAAELRAIRASVDEQGGHLLQVIANLEVSVGLQYRQAADSRSLLEQMAALRRRERSSPSDSSDRRWTGSCPYLGLMPFGQAQAQVFYGRDFITAQLVAALAQRQAAPGLLLLTGASGVGKSSLLRAGLIPAIARGELSPAARQWPRALLLEPGTDPMARLATLLAGLAAVDAPGVLNTLRQSPEQAHLLAQQAVDTDMRRRGIPEDEAARGRLLLVVDQFEEIFTQPDAPSRPDETVQERAVAFITALHAAAHGHHKPGHLPPALVVAAVRGDYIDRCAGHPLLAPAVRHPFVVEPMSEAELRVAITGPAEAAGLELEPGLVESILAELRMPLGGYDAGALPLLSQAMLTTWEHREDERLTIRGYARTGGVTHAVATSAEDTYATLEPAARRTARQLFQQLTAVSRDGTLTRRTAPRHALSRPSAPLKNDQHTDPADQVIDAFAARRLLITDEQTVQISHDVLLTAWPRLRGWLEDDLAGHALHSRLLRDADDWEHEGNNPDYLYRGERLVGVLRALESWQNKPEQYPALTEAAQCFVRVATQAHRRTLLVRRAVFATLSLFLVVAISAAVLAYRNQQAADRGRDGAVANSVSIRSEMLADDFLLSARLAAAAWHISPTADARAGMIGVLHNPTRAVLPHASGVYGVAFSPDGRTLASATIAGARGEVQFWDVATGEQRGAPLPEPSGGITSIAFSPDGRTLVTGSAPLNGVSSVDTGMVRFWDVATRQEIAALPEPTGNVSQVRFSPDGRTLASAASDDRDSSGTVRVWDVAARQQIAAFNDRAAGITTVEFSPDGRTLASASNSGAGGALVRLWEVATGRQVMAFPRHGLGHVRDVAFSPDGRLLAGAGSDGRTDTGHITLWDVATGKPLGAPLLESSGGVTSVSFSPHGHTLVSASSSGNNDAGVIRLWDVATRQQLGVLPRWSQGLNELAFNRDGHLLAGASVSSGGEGAVGIWDVATGHQTAALPHPGIHIQEVASVAFSPDGRTVVTTDAGRGNGIGLLHLRDVATGKQTAVLTDREGQPSRIVYSPDGRYLAADSWNGKGDATVRLWDVATGTQSSTFRASGQVLALAFSPDGRLLAVGDINPDDPLRGRVQLWGTTTGRPAAVFPEPQEKVYSIAFSPDGRTLATGGVWGTTRLWEVATGRQIGTLTHPPARGNVANVDSVAFSPDGRLLATSGGESDSGTTRLWEVATRRQVAVLPDPDRWVQAVAFSPDGRTLATGSGGGRDGSGMVRLWDVATGRQISEAVNPAADITSLAFSPDGRTLATNSSGSEQSMEILRLWNVGVPADTDLVKAVCAIAGRPLTPAEWAQYIPEVPFRPTCSRH